MRAAGTSVLLVLLDVQHFAVTGVDLDVPLTSGGLDRDAIDEISILVLELNARRRSGGAGERSTTRLIGVYARQALIATRLSLFLWRSRLVLLVGPVGFRGLVTLGLFALLVALAGFLALTLVVVPNLDARLVLRRLLGFDVALGRTLCTQACYADASTEQQCERGEQRHARLRGAGLFFDTHLVLLVAMIRVFNWSRRAPPGGGRSCAR